MISLDREFHYYGVLTIKSSHILGTNKLPKDDNVNWLFLKIGEKQFSFIYKIDDPKIAKYRAPFNASLSFMLIEEVKTFIQLNYVYQVLRGQEIVGTVKLIYPIDSFLVQEY